MTPAEHLALPNVEDVRQGIIASKIAAHAADIAKGVRGAREIDDKMADARRVLDWDAQWECAIDPETAKQIREDRKPEHEDTCSMCGKFCAVRSMNKALRGSTSIFYKNRTRESEEASAEKRHCSIKAECGTIKKDSVSRKMNGKNLFG